MQNVTFGGQAAYIAEALLKLTGKNKIIYYDRNQQILQKDANSCKILERTDKMKKIINLFVKAVEKTIEKESGSACCIIGYQPYMPDSVKNFKNRKKTSEK